MVSLERVSVVKTNRSPVIFPETDTVFCETDMVEVTGRESGAGAGPDYQRSPGNLWLVGRSAESWQA